MQNDAVVAVIAAHPDDEVIGCGGTIARLIEEGKFVHVLLLADGVTARLSSVDSSSAQNNVAARITSAKRANKILGTTSIEFGSFPDNRMDSIDRLDVIRRVEVFINRLRPSVVFTHYSSDANIDHRVAHDAVVVACRSQPGCCVKELMFFEIASSTEWNTVASSQAFWPNTFVNISSTLQLKMEALRAYGEELREFPHPRSVEAVTALAKWRGATAGFKAAEAFIQGRRII